MAAEIATVLKARALPNFVETKFTKEVTTRTLGYIRAGFPVHFRGPTGTGKTTLALHIAHLINRPVIMIHGDDEFTTSDLVGGEHGYRTRRVVDNFIHSVMKAEEDVQRSWVDNRLTVAVEYGFTLIYDEFTRSRPEANNILLSILQEKMMDLPVARGQENYLKVHPNFVAIFTSNPEEYAGVHRSQDALRDRMITIDLDYFDRETEIAITQAKSELSYAEAEKIVDIVRELRTYEECEFKPTIRGCIMIAKSLGILGGAVSAKNKIFREICQDILASESSRLGSSLSQTKVKNIVKALINKYC
ncbi:MAG: gas vesicle protein GvpN [Candidatus Atribacteria bacterium]|nr:gas vesicle protein GvpN [Candidatus Atribacteria bacterium]